MVKTDLKLLYIEDDENIRTIFESFFRRRISDVYTAINGQDGFILFKELKPDLIVTDIEMPLLDGISMIKKIRELDENIPIIVTSAHSDKDYLMNLINLNVTRFVIKPIDKTNLKTVIADAIELINLRKNDIKQKEEINKHNIALEEKVREKVTELKAKETLLIQQSKMAQMGNMIGVIAHQWKQPLNIISLTNELLKIIIDKDNIDKKDCFEQLQMISEQIKFMDTTMNDFKNFFSTKVVNEEFHIKSSVMMILTILKSKIKYINLDVEIKDDNNLTITGNVNEFKQVVLNIINNSIENFEDKKTKNPTLIIKINKNEEKDEICFEDNGGGIKEELLPYKIFENDVTTKNEGTGIGLNISKFIIENNFNGTLNAFNTKKGACFCVQIPNQKG